MAVKAAFILCLVLYKLTSGIKFAGEDCTKNEHCAQKDYSSKCVCDFSTDEATGEKFFKRGLCMDDPPDSGSCMTKYKWAKIKDKKKPKGPTGGKYLGETCTKKTDCLKTGDRGCTCPKGKCFGKNCKIKMAYKGETCKLKNDCFNSHGSKCTCPRNKCFGVQCMTEEQAKKASIPKVKEKKLVTKNVLAKSVPKVKAKKLVTKKLNSNVKSTSGIKFAGGDCTKNEDCAQKEYSSKCVCDFSTDKDTGEKFFKRGLCMDDPPFSGSCMTKFKWAKIKNKKKPTGPTGGKYLGESCTKKTDCLKTGDRGCTCPKGKCFGKNCMTKEQAKKASVPKVKEKKLVTKKSYSDVKKKSVKDLVKKFSGGSGKKGKKGRNQKCKKSKECMSGCKCLPWRGWKMKKCQGVCKKASYAAQFGDFGDEMYIENDEMGYGIGFSVFIGIVSLCFCGVMAVVMGVIGWYLGIYVGEYEKSGYNKLSQRGDVNDVEHNDA